MKTSFLFIFLMLVFLPVFGMDNNYDVISPNGALKIRISVSEEIHYEVFHNDVALIVPSKIAIILEDGRVVGKDATIKNTESKSVSETIPTLYGIKQSAPLDDTYNELIINFEEDYSLIVRAYDEGVAYRFATRFEGEVIVQTEEANFNFASNPTVWFSQGDENMRSWERSYQFYNSISVINPLIFSVTPAMFSYPAGLRVVIAESDQLDYPGMYIERSGDNSMRGKWAQYPKTVTDPNNMYAYQRVTERYDYLAVTRGERTYPWRVVIVSTQDKDLLTNELIFKLAEPQRITNTDWIKPGKSVWEWWHDGILEGVAFPAGRHNFDLYKFYIDFAADFGIEYITLDANYDANYVQQICQYANSLGVGVFIWDYINLPVWNPNRINTLKNWGAVGIKVDLIERDDQIAMNWIEKLAQDCADREMMLNFHGNPKPSGLNRTYPNILTFEAVRGNECNKWDNTANPDYRMQFIFIRMLAGPLDYTPGSMRQVRRSDFTPVDPGVPSSTGTRSNEMAMYVMFDQPLAYLCDTPIEYRKYPDIVRFLSNVPSVWDQTLPLEAEVGQYAVVARRDGDEWYVGAMTNWTARTVEVDFSFLPEGKTFVADILRDNEDTTSDPKRYTSEMIEVTSQSKLSFQLATGGGAVMRLYEGEITTGLIDLPVTRPEIDIVFSKDLNLQMFSIQSEMEFDTITVYDVKGSMKLQRPYDKRTNVQQVNISALSEGIYIVHLAGKAGGYALKFFK